MKTVLSGNEAIARGAFEAGVKVVSSYPGTPSTEITEFISKYSEIYVEWATNEKVALEVALGASLAGVRSMTAMKHVGLNVASDPLMTSSYTGVNGGLVIVVADDPNMHSSQNEQDSRNFARFAKLPMFEPSDSSEAIHYMKAAFEYSEEYCCPFILRSVTRLSHSMSVAETSERVEITPTPYKKDALRWVMTPNNARVRHKFVEDRIFRLQKISESYIVEKLVSDRSVGVVCSGVVYQYVKEALPDVSILKLGMVWPLPLNKIKEFAGKVQKLYVVEELDPIIETELRNAGVTVEKLDRSLCGELSVADVRKLFGREVAVVNSLPPSLPVRPPNMCAGCSHRGAFYVFNKLRLTVTGDIGCYTLGSSAPLVGMDSCLCMGASIPMAHGFDRGVNYSKTGGDSKGIVAVIGDSTFFHTGINGLVNTVFNGGSSTIVILDNRITGMTGHQPNPGTGCNIRGVPSPAIDLEGICRAIGVKSVHRADPFDVDTCAELLKSELAKEEVSVIIMSRSCIFVDKGAKNSPFMIDKDNCSGCKACLRLGCPAISWDSENKFAVIDSAICTGCGLCPKVCRFGAILLRQ